MTDEITPQSQPAVKKDEKKPSSGGNRGPKRQTSTPTNLRGGTSTNRPSSRGSVKKSSAPPSNIESGSDTASKKGSETGKKQESRGKSQSGGGRGQPHRRGQPPASHGTRNPRDHGSTKQSSSPAPPAQTKDSSDALSSLQRVIADLKTASPIQPPLSSNNTSGMPGAQGYSLQAPVFQPGASGYPVTNNDQKHRKAVSLGTSALPGNYNSFSPHLGAMLEDVEDGASFEEGEIQERFYQQQQQGHQPRSQSQSFMAPRFAALAAQQEQDTVGPTGRPQLAPGFMFGARKRSAPPMGPPISEEDVGFQFPQQYQNQQQLQNFPTEVLQQQEAPRLQGHRKSDSGEITGIMAEQVRNPLNLLSSVFI